jgi:hypothetical protein
MVASDLAILCHQTVANIVPTRGPCRSASASERGAQVETQHRDRVADVALRALVFPEGCNLWKSQVFGVVLSLPS